VSLINSKRLAKGLSSIGFINPTLYAAEARSSFNDVTAGNNLYCAYSGTDYSSSAVKCGSGFYAFKGWDPVSGLGSIYFPQLAALFNVSAPYTAKRAHGFRSKIFLQRVRMECQHCNLR
jgi:tripeptidyl-peptidase-1